MASAVPIWRAPPTHLDLGEGGWAAGLSWPTLPFCTGSESLHVVPPSEWSWQENKKYKPKKKKQMANLGLIKM